MNIVDRVQSLMKAKRMNRKELSAESGVPYTTICNIVNGDHEGMRVPTLKKLAECFHVSIDWLVYGDEGGTEFDNLMDVGRLALECADALREMSDMTDALGRMLIGLSRQTSEEKGVQP